MKKVIYLLAVLIFLYSCEKPKYPKGHYPDQVTNFAVVNSEYDDYNSDLQTVFGGFHFSFSTNRNSNGDNFDIISFYVSMVWVQTVGQLDVDASEDDDINPAINTQYNELGPYSIYTLFLYANDAQGNYDIKFLHKGVVSDIKFLKSDANELYPSFYGKDVYFANRNSDLYIQYVDKIEKIIYCSDKDGNFDIYEVSLPDNSNIVEILQSDEYYESVKLNVSSSFDDKCPFVNGDLLVFSSNRAGGYGGFDLYYSVYQNGIWSEPVNFGENINTQYDEYRPITVFEYAFDNNLLVFSSNRPGGLGGYDLYYVGFPKTIKIK
jgi:hypothetical protein